MYLYMYICFPILLLRIPQNSIGNDKGPYSIQNSAGLSDTSLLLKPAPTWGPIRMGLVERYMYVGGSGQLRFISKFLVWGPLS